MKTEAFAGFSNNTEAFAGFSNNIEAFADFSNTTQTLQVLQAQGIAIAQLIKHINTQSPPRSAPDPSGGKFLNSPQIDTLLSSSSDASTLQTKLGRTLVCRMAGVARSRLADLLPVWQDKDRCIQWCQEVGILPIAVNCDCGHECALTGHKCDDEVIWRCPRRGCQKRISLRANTLFQGSKLPIAVILQLLYWWSKEFQATAAAVEADVSRQTVTLWFSIFREICATRLLSEANEIGGVGHVVEIDESKFGKRKYNRGRLRDGAWVFGGLDRQTDDAFLVVVEDRSADTLIPIIQDKIRPGTTIHSDEWAAYNALGDHGFEHLTVNHSLHFVDPTTGAHTQRIESLWAAAKAKLKAMRGTYRDMLPTYLAEFLWRRKYGRRGTAFENIVEHISEQFSDN